MPPKPSQTSLKPTPPRLPPLPKLRVRRPNAPAPNPCAGLMTSMLSCWASSGYTAQGCIALEQSLRVCMDGKKPAAQKKNTINYHLMRLYPNIVGSRKRD